MLLQRLLRVVNFFLLLSALGLLAGVWWFFWRPLPQTSGRISAPVESAVSIGWDAMGVPHIHASAQSDAFFAQGYVTASERLWQMDGLRRTAAGDLSEIVGPRALAVDRQSRRLRMRRIAEFASTTLSAQDRDDIAAYARGVNHFIDTHRDRLSFEFAALGYSPKPWSIVDSILVGLYMYRDLTTSWPDHIERAQLSVGGDPAKVAFLFPARAGDEIQPGSNAWVVSGAHTIHGHPQLSNDMHLEFSIPGIWFMAALEAPGLRVAGVSLPGLPGIIVGHNQHIAWGVTNLHFNVQDVYREHIDLQTGRYEFRGEQQQARLETDLIPVKGQHPVELKQWITGHGPVFFDENGEHFSLRWTAAEPGLFAFPFTQIDRAENWQQFNAAVARLPGPGQNFVYADIDGNIGYHASGRLPIRRGFTGDVPLDGASGQTEWEGFIPYEQLPSAYNPPSGIIVTANQNPFPASYPYTVSGSFASPYRSRQIFDRLQSKGKLTPQDALAIQTDVYSAFEVDLARAIVKAWEARRSANTDLEPAVNKLKAFNGQLDKEAAAPFIIVLTDHYFREAMADAASPGKGHLYSFQMSYAAADRLLRERPPGWFADYDAVLLTALRDAVQEGVRKQGRNVDKWRYGQYLQLEVDQPVGHQLPLVSRFFDLGPYPMSGGSTTVKQTTPRLGPSERMNAVVGDWDKSLLNIPIGQSGHVMSRHYKDQWDAYYNGRSFPMAFDHVDLQSTLTLTPP